MSEKGKMKVVKKLTKKEKKPNYDKYFEKIVMDCAVIIVDAMKSSEKGDDLLFSCTIGGNNKKHHITIAIKKQE